MRNVRKIIEKKERKSLVLATAFALLGWVLSGCNASRDSICQEFPAVTTQIEGVRAEVIAFDTRVEPRRFLKAGRRPASVDMPTADEVRDHREVWMSWAEKVLKRAQWAKDALEEDPHGRRAVAALNDAGLSLVTFHGFVEQGKWWKAGTELERAETNLARARKLACEVESPAPRTPASAKKKHKT